MRLTFPYLLINYKTLDRSIVLKAVVHNIFILTKIASQSINIILNIDMVYDVIKISDPNQEVLVQRSCVSHRHSRVLSSAALRATQH